MKLEVKGKNLYRLVTGSFFKQNRVDRWFSYEDVVVVVDYGKKEMLVEQDPKSRTTEIHIEKALEYIAPELDDLLGEVLEAKPL